MIYCECKTLTGKHDRWCEDHPDQLGADSTGKLLKAAVDMSRWIRWECAEENKAWPHYLSPFLEALDTWEKENGS